MGEAGFFDWPLVVENGDDTVLDLVRRVSCFDWSAIDHDVLKSLYESVINPEVRHRLGEYYTPDWLADRMVRQVVTDPINQRVLDPACGSGTFLLARGYKIPGCRSRGVDTCFEALNRVTAQIAGVDLHPVAVALAQVTYLLAVGMDRLSERNGPFAVPVYVGDSMRWDDSSTGAQQLFHTSSDVVVHTTDGSQLFATELRFPAGVVAHGDFDSLVSEIVAKATNRKPNSATPNVGGIFGEVHIRQDGIGDP